MKKLLQKTFKAVRIHFHRQAQICSQSKQHMKHLTSWREFLLSVESGASAATPTSFGTVLAITIFKCHKSFTPERFGKRLKMKGLMEINRELLN